MSARMLLTQNLDLKFFQLWTEQVKRDLFLREKPQDSNLEWQKLLQKLAQLQLPNLLLRQPKRLLKNPNN